MNDKSKPKYPPLSRELRDRSKKYLRRGYKGPSSFLFRFLTALLLAYSILDIFVVWNILPIQPFDIPLYHYFKEYVVPGLLYPIQYLGINFNHSYETVLAVSAAGAAAWAGAQYRLNAYIILYFFPKIQNRPGSIDVGSWEKAPLRQEEPQLKKAMRFILRFFEVAFLTYTLLGLVAVLIKAIYGVRYFFTAISKLGVFLVSQLLYIAQHYTYYFEDFGNDDSMGTKVFCKVYDARRDIDNWMDSNFQPRVKSMSTHAVIELSDRIAREGADIALLGGLLSILLLIIAV